MHRFLASSLNRNIIAVDGKIPWHSKRDLSLYRHGTSFKTLLVSQNTMRSMVPGLDKLMAFEAGVRSHTKAQAEAQLKARKKTYERLKGLTSYDRSYIVLWKDSAPTWLNVLYDIWWEGQHEEGKTYRAFPFISARTAGEKAPQAEKNPWFYRIYLEPTGCENPQTWLAMSMPYLIREDIRYTIGDVVAFVEKVERALGLRFERKEGENQGIGVARMMDEYVRSLLVALAGLQVSPAGFCTGTTVRQNPNEVLGDPFEGLGCRQITHRLSTTLPACYGKYNDEEPFRGWEPRLLYDVKNGGKLQLPAFHPSNFAVIGGPKVYNYFEPWVTNIYISKMDESGLEIKEGQRVEVLKSLFPRGETVPPFDYYLWRAFEDNDEASLDPEADPLREWVWAIRKDTHP